MPNLLARLWNSPHIVLVLATLMWAGHTIAARLSVGEISPMMLMVMRWIACLVILVVLYRKKLVLQLPAVRQRLGWVWAMGGIGMAGFTIFFIFAAQHTTAVNLGITQSAIPALVMLIGLVVLHVRVGLIQVVGMLLSLIGVVVLVSGGSLAVLRALEFNIGDLMMLVACLCYAGYTVGLSRRMEMSPVLMLTFFSFFASLTLIGCVFIEYWRNELIVPGLFGIAIVLYCAIFPSMLAQIFFMRGVELAGANRAGLYVNLVPVFAAIMAVLFLAETMYFYHLASLGMVLGGIYLAERHKSATKTAKTD